MIKKVDSPHKTRDKLRNSWRLNLFFVIISFFLTLKIIVEVAYLQNFTIGNCPVSEIYAIEVSFRRKNFAAKERCDAGVNVLAVHMVCPLATFLTYLLI